MPKGGKRPAERHWHPSQKIKQLPGAEIELTLELGSLEEVKRWVLSWGEHASVSEPPELVKQITDVADGLVRKYAK
jgi:predicted DNA-binding transcriptional regulator YafY